MELIGTVGASFDDYGVDGEDLGWVTGGFVPSPAACNPHGIVQAGVHGLLLDAAMNFAINAALAGGDRTRATLEMKVETMRPALVGEPYRLRGEVVRMARPMPKPRSATPRTGGSAGRPGRSCFTGMPTGRRAQTPPDPPGLSPASTRRRGAADQAGAAATRCRPSRSAEQGRTGQNRGAPWPAPQPSMPAGCAKGPPRGRSRSASAVGPWSGSCSCRSSLRWR